MIKFHKPLKQAIFIQRKSASLVEVDIGSMKIDLLCPSHSKLANCAVLGSRIWYTPEELMPYYVPPIWQLSEVDYGNLVLVNNNLCLELFKDGFASSIIRLSASEGKEFKLFPEQSLPGGYGYDFNLQFCPNSSKNATDVQNSYIIVTGSTYNNDEQTNNMNYFPEVNYLDASHELYNLIHAKMLGHRAVLCCFILNNGVNKISLTNKYDPQYAKLLNKALDVGVEFIAYSTQVNSNGIQVVSQAEVKF